MTGQVCVARRVGVDVERKFKSLAKVGDGVHVGSEVWKEVGSEVLGKDSEIEHETKVILTFQVKRIRLLSMYIKLS